MLHEASSLCQGKQLSETPEMNKNKQKRTLIRGRARQRAARLLELGPDFMYTEYVVEADMHIKTIRLIQKNYPTRQRYPFNLDILQETKSVNLSSCLTFFVGENGTGKSTLLRAIANRCGIYMWQGVQRTRLEHNPYENALYKALEVDWADGWVAGSYFASETFKHFAQVLEDWASTDKGQLDYFGGSSLLTKSHGQSILAFFESRYDRKGLYLLDEPETALSPASQLRLLSILTRAAQTGNAQFLIASHSPILMACPQAELLSFDGPEIAQIQYEDTDHYRVYRDFMAERQSYIKGLK
jgi:predicted ATPase